MQRKYEKCFVFIWQKQNEILVFAAQNITKTYNSKHYIMNKYDLLTKMIADNLQDIESGNEIARKNLLILAKELEKIANGK